MSSQPRHQAAKVLHDEAYIHRVGAFGGSQPERSCRVLRHLRADDRVVPVRQAVQQIARNIGLDVRRVAERAVAVAQPAPRDLGANVEDILADQTVPEGPQPVFELESMRISAWRPAILLLDLSMTAKNSGSWLA